MKIYDRTSCGSSVWANLSVTCSRALYLLVTISRSSVRVFSCLLLLLFPAPDTAAVSWEGDTDSCWATGMSWTGGMTPNGTDCVIFGDNPCSTTVNIGCTTRDIGKFVLCSNTCGWNFEGGAAGSTITLCDNVDFLAGSVTFTNIAFHTECSDGKVAVGDNCNAGSVTFICSSIYQDTSADFEIRNGTFHATGGNFCIADDFHLGRYDTAAATFINASICVPDSIDVGLSGCCGGQSSLFITGGCLTVGGRLKVSNGTLDITGTCVTLNDDLQLAEDAEGTINLTGVMMTIVNEIDFKNNFTQHLTIDGGSCITVNSGSGCLNEWGRNCIETRININGNGTVLTVNDASQLDLNGNNTIMSICAGTMAGNAEILLNGNAIIKGANCGLITSAIKLSGGRFQTGSSACDVLILGGAVGSITSDGGEDLYLDGLGTIQIGTANVIDATVDVVMNGGTLDLNANSQEIANLTLTADSYINFTANTSSQDFTIGGTLSGLSATIGLTITGWGGTLGSNGDDGRLMSTTPYTDAELQYVIFDIGGIFYPGTWLNDEIVPLSAIPIPEASTWFGGGAIVAIAVTHYLRRRKRKTQAAVR